MADVPAPASDDLTPQDHLDLAAEHVAAAHAHLVGAGAAEHHDDAQGDAGAGDGEPRGMQRFSALSAERRSGFPAGSGAARSMAAMRGR